MSGLFSLRLQLKSLRFHRAPLVSLLALLAPHVVTARASAKAVPKAHIRNPATVSQVSPTLCNPDKQSGTFLGFSDNLSKTAELSENRPGGEMVGLDNDAQGRAAFSMSGASTGAVAARSCRARRSPFDTSAEPTSTSEGPTIGRGSGGAGRLEQEGGEGLRAEREQSQILSGRAASWVAPRTGGSGELAGLRLSLGKGTPTLRWSLLEVLR